MEPRPDHVSSLPFGYLTALSLIRHIKDADFSTNKIIINVICNVKGCSLVVPVNNINSCVFTVSYVDVYID